jgi:hypothetical protein
MKLPLKLTKYLENENDYLPWKSVADGKLFLNYRRNTTEFDLIKVWNTLSWNAHVYDKYM